MSPGKCEAARGATLLLMAVLVLTAVGRAAGDGLEDARRWRNAVRRFVFGRPR